MDIHTIKYANGQLVSFIAREDNYFLSEDDYPFREFRTWFGSYTFEYLSPANILTGYEEHNNIYRNYSREQKTAILNKMDNEKLPYEINRKHLHHLHLALNPNRGLRVLKIVVLGFIGCGIMVLTILEKRFKMQSIKEIS